jgi:polyisoprenoid-binding protein YceI
MNYSSTLIATVLLLTAGEAALAQQKIVPAQSEISFTSRQMGVPVDGKFRQWTGKVSFTIDTGSASFGAAETDAEVPKAPWFNVAKFPQASFASTGIKSLGAGKLEVAGKLSIKGSQRDVVVPVMLSQSGANTTAAGSFTIKRLDFKIGDGEWADTSMVANEVVVKFKLAVTGVAPL